MNVLNLNLNIYKPPMITMFVGGFVFGSLGREYFSTHGFINLI